MTAEEEAGWIMVVVSLVFLVAYVGAREYQEYKRTRRFTREIQRKAWGKR